MRCVLVLVLGIVINNSIKSGERATDLRSEIYKTIGGDLSDIYACLAFVFLTYARPAGKVGRPAARPEVP